MNGFLERQTAEVSESADCVQEPCATLTRVAFLADESAAASVIPVLRRPIRSLRSPALAPTPSIRGILGFANSSASR